MAENIKVCYLGNDISYWKKIQSEYRDIFPEGSFNFVRLEVNKDWMVPTVFCEIAELRAQILYVDFTLGDEKCMELCKLIRRDSTTKRISTTALHGYNEFKENISKSLMAGIRINHIKSGEICDVAYDGMCLYDVDQTALPEYATAETEISTTAIQNLRVGYVDNHKFHIETNSPLKEGSSLQLGDHFLEKIMECKSVEVSNQSDRNLYYDLNYSYDLLFEFSQKYVPDKDEKLPDESIKAQLKEQFEAQAEKDKSKIQANLNKWLDIKSQTMTIPKKAKFMVIDRSLTFLRDGSIDTKKLDYCLNLHSKLQGQHEQIKRFMPHVIIFNYEKPPEPEVKKIDDEEEEDEGKGKGSDKEKDKEKNESEINIDDSTNGIASLANLIRTIQTVDGYEPIVVVFDTGDEKNSIKEQITYPKILTYSEPLSIEVVNNLSSKMLASIEAADQKAIEEEEGTGADSKRVYFSSSEKESIIHLKRPITIIELNEICLYFESEENIPPFTTFKIKEPFSALLTVVPIPSLSPHNDRPNTFYAILNGIGEDEKKEVRQLINSLIYEKQHPPKEDEIDDGLTLWERREKEKAKRDRDKAEAEKKKKEKAAQKKAAQASEKARIKKEMEAEMAAAKIGNEDEKSEQQDKDTGKG